MPIPDRRSNTGTYPACQAEHVELGLLHEYRPQHERGDRPHRRPDNPIKAFGEHHAAERLHQHEHGRHRGAGLLQFQQHGNAQRQQRRGDRLEQMKPDRDRRPSPSHGRPQPSRAASGPIADGVRALAGSDAGVSWKQNRAPGCHSDWKEAPDVALRAPAGKGRL